jgi:hypothetical protein
MTTDEMFDVTARKVHQWTCVALLAAGFVLGTPIGTWLVGIVGVIMLAGRFWWPADIFRQLTWRVLEPAGIVRRREVQEDHDTRRIARVLGGIILLASAALLAAGIGIGWVLAAAIGIMIALDAAFSFCVLCFLTYQAGKLQTQQ